MHQFIILGLVFLVGVLAAFIGSMVGGGGLISIPFMIFAGLPSNFAVATNKFGGVGLTIGGFIRYFKGKKIQWKYVLPFSVIAIAGGIIGANILLSVNEDILGKAVGIFILILLPTIFIKRKIGVKRTKPTKKRMILGYFFYFLTMIWGGFFGGGGGTIIFFVIMMFFGLTIIEAAATDKIPWFLMSLTSLIIFIINGVVNFLYGFFLMGGMILGGYLGAHFAIKKGDKWVKVLFAVVVVASAIKLVFF